MESWYLVLVHKKMPYVIKNTLVRAYEGLLTLGPILISTSPSLVPTPTTTLINALCRGIKGECAVDSDKPTKTIIKSLKKRRKDQKDFKIIFLVD